MHSNEEPAWCPDTDELLEMLAHARVWAMAMAERHRLRRATLEFSVAAFSRGAVALLEQTPCRGACDYRLSTCWFRDDTVTENSSGTCRYELLAHEAAPVGTSPTALELRIFARPGAAVAGVFLKGTDELLNGEERRGLQFWRDDDRNTGSSAYVGSSTPGRHCFDAMTRVL